MKTTKVFFLLALLMVSAVVSAQEYAFKVLANKGKNEVKSGTDWQPLKTGATLYASDEVKLSDNAYIGLVHSTGKPVEVKESGVYKVSTLEDKVPQGSSVLNKYTDFILSSTAEAKKNRLSATGAVSREVAKGSAIKVFLPENSPLFSKKVIVNWEDRPNGAPYIVTVMNMFEDVLEKIESPEASFELDLSTAKFAQETAILIEVTSKTDQGSVSKRHVIKKMSAADLEKISAALQNISGEIKEETAVNKLILAGFYENNNLLADAILAYEQALKLEPEAYTEAYDDFLTRNNLK